MIDRVYVERRDGFRQQAEALLDELRNLLNIKNLENVRILERYDIEDVKAADLERCKHAVFADPCIDIIVEGLDAKADRILGVEYLPGQFDQRADAASQCIALLLDCDRPNVRTARIYLFYGEISDEEFNLIKQHLINPVECCEAELNKISESLSLDAPAAGDVKILNNFINLDDNALEKLIKDYGLAMNLDDLICCRDYFKSEHRNPSMTELKVLDTYWSDHCRHTTFMTQLDNFECSDERVSAAYNRYLALRRELKRDDKPITLMDMATIGAKALKARGLLKDLDESDEINACTVRIEVNNEPWLLLFKNETHNHPTEIEPFGGAATCIGGAIRDPLSGRGYVYQAMRLTGAADPRTPLDKTLSGKLPQRTITIKAAEGYSSYGNQIGIPTGIVDEIYHENYAAKRMEVGAVIAAVPERNVRREVPKPGDLVLLIGGKTGRDGCGGATGSSRAHNLSSLETCGAEVQKGNAPMERKLQRLFRNPEFSRLIKRCNDFGAGGVSVAIGELADGLKINLDAVPLKYSGLDGTEIAISESQERMAVVIDKNDLDLAVNLALSEDLDASLVAEVTGDNRVVMTWRNKEILNLSREFISSSGAVRHVNIKINDIKEIDNKPEEVKNFSAKLREVLADLNVCSKRGLAERFDSSVGANSVLIPFGGVRQRTPAQVMAAKLPVLNSNTNICSLMAWGFDPFISSKSPYDGAYLAVIESISKLAAAGADLSKCWLSFQEYFGRVDDKPERWGLPAAALLGALDAQLDLGIAAIGGKDSMSGSFNLNNQILDVPPTLISFAVSLSNSDNVISPEFKRENSRVVLLRPEYNNKIPDKNSMLALLRFINKLNSEHKILAAATPVFGGIAAMVFKMCLGNNLGFEFNKDLDLNLFGNDRGSFILELEDDAELELFKNINCVELGHVIKAPELVYQDESLKLAELEEIYENVLEKIFPVKIKEVKEVKEQVKFAGSLKIKAARPVIKFSRPRFLIPVFPGTNCEYESAKSVTEAGGEAEIFVIKTLTPELMQASAREFAAKLNNSQALFLPGGFSNGDEPDGSGKFIAIFLRSPVIREAVQRLLDDRQGLICGICNGFQALIKTGLLPFGRIVESDELNENSASLTFNIIGRHQAKLIRSKVINNASPWLSDFNIGDVSIMPISHGEGRFICGCELLNKLALNGQIAAQYVDMNGSAAMDVNDNPNGSIAAIECITSPDGRILGRMGHAERVFKGLYKNAGENMGGASMFSSAVKFFK
ncbi:MAG: phosphoribosylformylglycinamidine synthase [Synergistaceae bacterium]|nr:phosphoribosylformylglycinamidine synthase [Synergistaceae bacterium]